MENATFLTEQYPRKESEVWTPCIYDFFCQHEPVLPVSACIMNPSPEGPWYKHREQESLLNFTGAKYKEPWADEFLLPIEKMYGCNLTNNPPGRNTATGDIAGICPDIVLVKPDRQGVYLIENKPYYESAFDGNQGAGGAYIKCVKWLNDLHIKCEYILIQSISTPDSTFRAIQEVQKEFELLKLGNSFGLLLLEDIFSEMGKNQYKYSKIVNWENYTDKGDDFLEC